MSKSAVITARVDADVIATLDKLGAHYERSRSWLVAKAVERFAREEADFLAFVEEGSAAIARGDFLTHHEMIAEIEARKAKRRNS